MAKYSTGELDTIFSALADPTRRAILDQLIQGKKTVGEVAEPFDYKLPTISRHIRVLEQAGLLTRERQGRLHYLTLNAVPFQQAIIYLIRYRAFWQEALQSLDGYLKQQASEVESDDRSDSPT
jgi:DNA-binding transcriptional ArsR family regulator